MIEAFTPGVEGGGPITKTGNSHVRRALIEAAWTYKMQARVSTILVKRQQGLPKSVCDISWKAQTRLLRLTIYTFTVSVLLRAQIFYRYYADISNQNKKPLLSRTTDRQIN